MYFTWFNNRFLFFKNLRFIKPVQRSNLYYNLRTQITYSPPDLYNFELEQQTRDCNFQLL